MWPPERTYFIADIGANHDGDFDRAIKLIRLCASVGVDAVKFQHFRAPRIVSRSGFDGMKVGHQAAWPQGVYETYEAASLPWEWTARLADECQRFGMEFMSTPYDLEAVEHLDPYVSVWKIGSGDITYHALIEACARTGKPVILSTGAAWIQDVELAMALLAEHRTALLQCGSDYTGSSETVKYANVSVLNAYRARWPLAVLGLSDHSPNYTAVLPAVALGARIIEKHFTDDPKRSGPDHGFSMDPHIWHDCIERTRECVAALGTGVKGVEANERESFIVQRRCIRAARSIRAGHILTAGDLEVLRPAPHNSLAPYEMVKVIGRTLAWDVEEGEVIEWAMLSSLAALAVSAALS